MGEQGMSIFELFLVHWHWWLCDWNGSQTVENLWQKFSSGSSGWGKPRWNWL